MDSCLDYVEQIEPEPPVCKDLTSVREPFETELNLSQGCELCTGLDTLSCHSVSGDSHEPLAPQRSTRFSDVRHIFNVF